MTISQKIGKAIRAIRKERKISQEVLVNNLIGRDKITLRYLVDIERGKRNISLSILQVIADGLEMKMSELTKIAEDIEDDEEEKNVVDNKEEN